MKQSKDSILTTAIMNLWAAGLTSGAIARQHGVSRNAVMGVVNRATQAGKLVPRGGKRGTLTEKVAIWMSEFGGTIPECADALDKHVRDINSAWRAICAQLGAQAV